MIHLFRPNVGPAEMLAAMKIIRSRWLGEGPQVAKFSERWAAHLGVPAGQLLPLATASDALCLTMEMLNVGSGDEIIVPSIHFVGAANAVLRRGATPIFCDVDAHTLNTDITHVKAKVTGRTRAVMVLHYGGLPCDLNPIQHLGFPVIEDAAVAVGASYRGRACGTVADVGLWSFDAMKMMAAGTGGMLWCQDEYWAKRGKLLSRLGISQQHGLESDQDQWWAYRLELPGRLSEMNDLTAAMALVQLDKLASNLKKRRAICRYYDSQLRHLVTTPPSIDAPTYYWIQTERRNDLAKFLRQRDIYTSFRYWPLHWAMNVDEHLPGAEWAARHTLLLPLHSALTWRQVRTVCTMVRRFFE